MAMENKAIATVRESVGHHGTDTERHPTHHVYLEPVPAYSEMEAAAIMVAITEAAYPGPKERR